MSRHRTIASRKMLERVCIAGLLAISTHVRAVAQAPHEDLSALSVEDLMNVEVTSVSKKEQRISQAAAAIFVITREDISRSGALNIPDLLRNVPGLNVAQIDASVWAISARGFNANLSNKLLVLLDGRSVYLPTTSGVFWDVLDVPLEDIERIEVIRGPGGATWGANAVNGVINIITRKAAETRGGTLTAGGGNLTPEFATAQYGGEFGANTGYRVFAKYLNDAHQPGLNGQSDGDGWHAVRAGFRTDSRLSEADDLGVTGNLYSSRAGFTRDFFPAVGSPVAEPTFQEANTTGGYLQANWKHRVSERSDTTLQVSFDRYRRDDELRETRNTLNADFTHHFLFGTRQDVVWGAGYRYSSSTTDGNLSVSLNPPDLNTQLFSSFVQDEIALLPERLSVTLGGKIEHNYYTGFGFMPTARTAWNFHKHQMIWAAVSRALRTPASVDAAVRITVDSFVPPGGPPVLVQLRGNPGFQNEKEIAYEAGYRSQIRKHFSLDLAAYYNVYHELATSEPGPPLFENSPAPFHEVVPLTNGNLMDGETHGLEFSAKWQVTSRLTLTPGYSFEQIHLHLDPGSHDTQSVATAEGSTPRQWAMLDARVALSHSVEWNASAIFAGRLANPSVPSYTRVDTDLTWRLSESLSAKLVGQNLLRDHHLEFLNITGVAASSYIRRSAYVELTWNFK